MSDFVKYISGAKIGGTGTVTIDKGTFMKKDGTENGFIACAAVGDIPIGVLDKDAKPGEGAFIASWQSDVVLVKAGGNKSTQLPLVWLLERTQAGMREQKQPREISYSVLLIKCPEQRLI